MPNITILNKNAIIAANDLLVPVLPDFLSFDGLTLLFNELKRMQLAYAIYDNRFTNGLLDNIYIFLNQYRSKFKISKESKKALEEHYSDYLCRTIIPFDTKITEATAAGMPIFQYCKNSLGAKQIKLLIKEILEKYSIKNNRGHDEKKAFWF